MTNGDFEEMCNEFLETTRKLGYRKGLEYAGSEDRLANFKRNAEALGGTPEYVLMVYAGKHWDAITTHVRRLNEGMESLVTTEPIQNRIMDLINYLLMLNALTVEREERKCVSSSAN